ncbi:MAG: Na+/H+ antiporter NhaA [Pseudonocardiales bacterium]
MATVGSSRQDDIIVIVIIAVFYSESISLGWLGAAAIGLAVMVALRRFGVGAVWPYALIGTAVWYATDSSGVHATIAGVALGLLTPARPVRGREVLHELEHRPHPVTAFTVVPSRLTGRPGWRPDCTYPATPTDGRRRPRS